jgi:hypothetical protein
MAEWPSPGLTATGRKERLLILAIIYINNCEGASCGCPGAAVSEHIVSIPFLNSTGTCVYAHLCACILVKWSEWVSITRFVCVTIINMTSGHPLSATAFVWSSE